MDSESRNAAPTAYRGDGAVPVQRSRSLRRLLSGKQRAPASTTASPTPMYPPTPRFPSAPRFQQYTDSREQRALEQNRTKRSASSDSYHSVRTPFPQPKMAQPMPSEAARLRSLNTSQQSTTHPDPRYKQDIAPPRENFSRPRQLSVKKGTEPSRTASSPDSTLVQKFRGDINPSTTRPELGRERGFSESPASMPTSFVSSRPLRNSVSIPELSAAEWQQNISNKAAHPRNGLRVRNQSPNVDLHPGFPRGVNGEEARESFRSVQTTGTTGTGTTWKTDTTSTTWGTNTMSGFLDAERSSIMSKSSSVNGRDQIDDFLDMYDGGFGESGAEDEPSQHRPSTSHSIRSERYAEPTIQDLRNDTLAVPKLSNLIIRDSTDMFRTPPAFVDPFDNEAHGGSASNPQSQSTQGIARQPSGRRFIGAQYSQFDATRDRYGFKKETQYVSLETYEDWDRTYEPYLARRRMKWNAVMKSNGLGIDNPTRFPPKSVKIKRFVRKGIPPDWRGEAWFWYAGGHQLLAKYPGVYDDLVRRAANGQLSPTDEELIERDLNRTFPDNLMYKPDPTTPAVRLTSPGGSTPNTKGDAETPILKSLRRVLQATSIYNPKIGYCQSLNFLAGLLLLFMTEERAFWMLDIILKSYLPGTHDMNLEGANVDLGVLMMCIRESMPAVWAKIGGELDGSASADERQVPMRLPPITLCCTAWFMSCFIGSLPVETTLRVWDAFFFEGSKTLFRVALAIFKVGEAEIRAVADPMEVFQVVQTIPRKFVDVNVLMATCFRRRNGFGHLTQSTIDERRAERRRGYAEERAVAAGERPTSKRSNLFSTIRGRRQFH